MRAPPHRLLDVQRTVRDLGLEVGSLAVAVVKAAMVIVEIPREQQ